MEILVDGPELVSDIVDVVAIETILRRRVGVHTRRLAASLWTIEVVVDDPPSSHVKQVQASPPDNVES